MGITKNGANINVQDKRSKTDLMLASRRGNLGIFKLLLKKGGDPFIEDFEVKTASDYARESLQKDALGLFDNDFFCVNQDKFSIKIIGLYYFFIFCQ